MFSSKDRLSSNKIIVSLVPKNIQRYQLPVQISKPNLNAFCSTHLHCCFISRIHYLRLLFRRTKRITKTRAKIEYINVHQREATASSTYLS